MLRRRPSPDMPRRRERARLASKMRSSGRSFYLVSLVPPGRPILTPDFRSVQARHERARRQLQAVDQIASSMHFSSPSQTSGSAGAGKPGLPGLPRRKPGSQDKRIDPGLGSGTGRIASGLSPLNPKRVGSGAAAALVAAGGAVASMQGLGVMRPTSPPPAASQRKRVFPSAGAGRR